MMKKIMVIFLSTICVSMFATCSDPSDPANPSGPSNPSDPSDPEEPVTCVVYDKIITPPAIPTIDESDYTAYYFDPVNGNNANNGLSEATAFKTISKFSEMIQNPLPPKTKMLLKSGAVFDLTDSWAFVLKNLSGTESKPFILDVYGGIERATVNAVGEQALAIQDDNCRVRNIKFTNKTGTRGIRLQAHAKGAGAFRNVVIQGCRIEEINWAGTDAVEGANPANLDVEKIAAGARFSTKEFGGIIFDSGASDADKAKGPLWYENVWVTNNEFYKCCRQGILITAKWGQRDKPGNGWNAYIDDEHNWYPHKNIVIQGNDFNYIGGDGVDMMGCTNSYIDHNRCYNANFLGRSGQASAGLWPYCCTNIVMQYNEAAYTWLAHGSADGQGLDVDMACKNTLVQYNYVHHNKGGGILLCNLATGDHTGTVIRNNVFALNDGSYRGSLATISGSVGRTDIYNNIIILDPATPKIILSDDWPKAGKSTDITFKNNIFMAASPCSATFDRGNINVLTFSNNLFFQVGSVFSLDPAPLRYDPKVTIPSSPNGYSKITSYRPTEPNVFKDGLVWDGMPEKDAAGVSVNGIKYIGAFAK